jgi:site-specific recombinase XerD
MSISIAPPPTAQQYNERLISRYITHLQSERGLSENTVNNYVRDIRKLTKWFRRPITEITCKDITQFSVVKLGAGINGRSVRRHLAAFRSFFGFLIDDEEIKRDPTVGVPKPRYTKPLPGIARQADVESMIAALGESSINIRDRAMLYLFFGSGLRESELADLMLKDIDLDRGVVKIWGGKGKKDAILPLSGSAIDALHRYLAAARPILAEYGFGAKLVLNPSRQALEQRAKRAKKRAMNPKEPSRYLFIGRRTAQKLTRMQVYNRVRAAGRVLGRTVSPHQLRHGYATSLVENGADILDVQTLMRHARVSTTQRYLHLNLNYLKEKYDDCHPRARLARQDRGLFDPLQSEKYESTFRPRLPHRPLGSRPVPGAAAPVPDQPQDHPQLRGDVA